MDFHSKLMWVWVHIGFNYTIEVLCIFSYTNEEIGHEIINLERVNFNAIFVIDWQTEKLKKDGNISKREEFIPRNFCVS